MMFLTIIDKMHIGWFRQKLTGWDIFKFTV